jgi:sulfur-carrier protein
MIKVWVHPNIVRLTGSQTEWRLRLEKPETPLSDILESVFADTPNLLSGIIDETGAVRKHLNIFIGNENIRQLADLETLVGNDAEISVFTAVSGG